METAANGWSRDVMLSQITNGYIKAKGNAITNFQDTLPAYQSDLAQYAFKDPYNFSFLGTVALQHELDIEKNLAQRITNFLLELLCKPLHNISYANKFIMQSDLN